jgi:hypothetical protein
VEPKILFCDIETSPIVAYVWGLRDQNIALNQIKEDWSVLSWAAKWKGDKKIHYSDVRGQRNLRDDKKLLKGIHALLNAADIVIWHYGKNFDRKKLNARFIQHKMKPPSEYRQLDTKEIASREFAFTSNKLEYISGVSGSGKKSQHKKFPGMELWTECLKGNLEAFKEMEAYNKQDIVALEQSYDWMQAWDTKSINFNIYRTDQITNKCNCGSSNFTKDGKRPTNAGIFQKYRCVDCGKGWVDRGAANNSMSKEKRSGLKRVQT